MPELDPAWEYHVVDPEVSEFFADEREKERQQIICAKRGDAHFFFAGSDQFERGRFFDGLQLRSAAGRSFGGVYDQDLSEAGPFSWFVWSLSGRFNTDLIGLFEEQLRSVDRQNRADWLASTFCSAWDKMPPDLQSLLSEITTFKPQPRGNRTGRLHRPFKAIADRLGLNYTTVYRRYLGARFQILLAAIPDEAKAKCGCGCGQPVNYSTITSPKAGYRLGQPYKFLAGHDPASKAKRTHCPLGHPFDETNTYLHNGQQHCKTCKSDRQRKARAAAR